VRGSSCARDQRAVGSDARPRILSRLRGAWQPSSKAIGLVRGMLLRRRMSTHAAAFDRDEAIRYGWKQALAHLRTVASVVAIGWFVGLLEQMLRRAPGALSLGSSLAFLGLQAVQIAVTLGAISVFLRIHDGQSPRVRDMLDALPQFFPFLLAQIIYGLIAAGGIVLLIVPGIIWAIRFGLFSFFIVDKKLDPIEALRASWRLTRGHTLELFWFGLLILAINLLGAIALGLGLLITIPTTAIAGAHVYRRLLAVQGHDATTMTTVTGPLVDATH
jgi:hypothetical protein